ncbi:MAG TPA: cache domain-containing protein, partial [Verrucomicrobiae bacterium]|nr:cache domain-containing protein [Verrucomicrobiae bacterium]
MTALSHFPKFRTRLIILVLLLVTPAFGLVLYGNLEQRRIEKAKVRQGATALSELAGANQAAFVKNTRQLLATLTQFPFLVLATNRPFCEVHFSNLLKLSPDYLNFGLIEADGTLFCNGVATNVSENLNDRSYFQRVLRTKRFSIGDFQAGPLTAQPEVSFGYPVLDEKGGLKRVLFASLNLSLLSKAVDDVRLPAGGAVTVIDRNGTVLAHHPEPEKWVGKSLKGTRVAERILAQREAVFEMPGLDGVPRLHAVTQIKEGEAPGLFVSVGIPLEVSFAHANQALVRNLIVL